MNRNLDGVYFRVKRNEEWQNICFSDLTEEEMDNVLDNRNRTYVVGLAKILAKTLHDVGDRFDIVCDYEEEV